MPGRRYAVYDVFTLHALAGNPLAVVFDAEGLDAQAMQAIAREFNLSETVFVLPPRDGRHKARIRIFTPDHELPFAGHPTVGSAIALSGQSGARTGAEVFVIEEEIGPVRCAVRRDADSAHAEFDLPALPRATPLGVEPELLGAALGVPPHRIGFENHKVSLWSAGVPFVLVPVADRATAAAAKLDSNAWLQLAPGQAGGRIAWAYLYCRETLHHDCDFHARMFAAGTSFGEDPATGSAVAAFAGAVAHYDRPPDGISRLTIEQGIEMGRPSRIGLELDMRGGELAAARIGGNAVRVAEGLLFG